MSKSTSSLSIQSLVPKKCVILLTSTSNRSFLLHSELKRRLYDLFSDETFRPTIVSRVVAPVGLPICLLCCNIAVLTTKDRSVKVNGKESVRELILYI